MNSLRSLYDWLLKQAEKPYAEFLLFGVAFAEASFFPLPPDILLLPMVLARRDRAWKLGTICTVGSMLGALLGYGIGMLGMATIGRWIVNTYHLQGAFQKFQDGFAQWGVWLILAKGLTPIPFKLITIASGVAELNLVKFMLACAVTRGARFFLVALLVKLYGEPIKVFIEKYLNWIALAVLVVIILGFVLVLK